MIAIKVLIGAWILLLLVIFGALVGDMLIAEAKDWKARYMP